MKETIFNSLSQGQKSLEDLKMLVDSSCQLFVDQVIHHITELRSSLLKENGGDLSSFKNLLQMVEKNTVSELKDLILKSDKVNQVVFVNNANNINLQVWNRTFEVLPLLSTIVDLLGYKDDLVIELGTSKLMVTGIVNQDEWKDDIRKRIYSITRSLLNHQTLLTFELVGSTNSEQKLKIIFDLSHDERMVYQVDTASDSTISYGFSGLFFNYTINANNFAKLGPHTVIEIDHLLRVSTWDSNGKYLQRKVDSITSDAFKGVVVHFPFLFRPLSLIIPKRGFLIPFYEILSGHGGSEGLYIHGKDSKTNLVSNFKYFDIFELFKQ